MKRNLAEEHRKCRKCRKCTLGPNRENSNKTDICWWSSTSFQVYPSLRIESNFGKVFECRALIDESGLSFRLERKKSDLFDQCPKNNAPHEYFKITWKEKTGDNSVQTTLETSKHSYSARPHMEMTCTEQWHASATQSAICLKLLCRISHWGWNQRSGQCI